jgi:alpha-beta hydrolase superfamily lysophospholipase
MGLFFTNDLHDEFGTWPLAYIRYGGLDAGEILAVAKRVGDGDDGAFHAAWTAMGDALAAEAEAALAKRRPITAREFFLKAACAYDASYHPLYGEPVDPRLLTAFSKQIDTFNKGLALSDPPIEPLRIPFEGTSLPAYLIPATGRAHQVRPLLILTNGYDATVTDMYFASAVAATQRGYHCLLFDGPGQGAALYRQGLRLRPDWETVVGAVVDFAIDLPLIDPARIAIYGWSLGGHLAPRAASGEHRLAACVADPGEWSITGSIRAFAIKLGAAPDAVGNLAELDQQVLDRMEQVIVNTPKLSWSIIKRGYWVHGVSNLRDFLRVAEPFTMDGRAEQIRCPILLTTAENDPLAAGAQAFFDALRCPKTLIRFTAAQGAGEHCEMRNRSLLNARVLDWLDEVLSA